MADETQIDPVVETKEYADGTTATGIAPLPDQSPAEQEASEKESVTLTLEQRFDAVLIWLRDQHGFHLPEHLAPKE